MASSSSTGMSGAASFMFKTWVSPWVWKVPVKCATAFPIAMSPWVSAPDCFAEIQFHGMGDDNGLGGRQALRRKLQLGAGKSADRLRLAAIRVEGSVETRQSSEAAGRIEESRGGDIEAVHLDRGGKRRLAPHPQR